MFTFDLVSVPQSSERTASGTFPLRLHLLFHRRDLGTTISADAVHRRNSASYEDSPRVFTLVRLASSSPSVTLETGFSRPRENVIIECHDTLNNGVGLCMGQMADIYGALILQFARSDYDGLTYRWKGGQNGRIGGTSLQLWRPSTRGDLPLMLIISNRIREEHSREMITSETWNKITEEKENLV